MNMIILIADDDKLIRFTMKSMLNDILTADCTFLEAGNGKELLHSCLKYSPDIAFVDIKMPLMDGLTAIEQCREASSLTEFVVISGYSEFEYAKKCITLDVTEYLLKPVEEESLRKILEVLKEKLEHTKTQSNSTFRLLLLNSFNYLSTVGDALDFEEPELEEGEFYFVFYAFFQYSKNKQTQYKQLQQHLVKKSKQLGSILIKQHQNYSLIYTNEGNPCFVFKTHFNYETSLRRSMEKIASPIQMDGILFSMVYFKNDSFSGIYNTCERLDKSQSFCLNYPNGSFIPFSCNQQFPDQACLSLVNQLLDSYQNADEVLYHTLAGKIYDYLKDKGPLSNLHTIAANIECITGFPVASEDSKSFYNSLKELEQSIYTNIVKPDNNMIDQIKDHIDRNYMNDISINQIAELFDLTPNYLSALFHQKAKQKFIDYLTGVRIIHAKKLLIQNNTASVKDIALMVGYNSPRHFSTLFQKMLGMTPSAYRRKNQ